MKKIARSRETESQLAVVFCLLEMSVRLHPCLPKQDLNKDDTNSHTNMEMEISWELNTKQRTTCYHSSINAHLILGDKVVGPKVNSSF